jgi:hypothetical protein
MKRRVIIALVASACVLAGVTSLALGASIPRAYDFTGHRGKFTAQVRQSGKKLYMSSFTLLCGQYAYVLATSKARLSRSGAFSYSGAGMLISQTTGKKSKTTFAASGKISISKRTGSAKARSTGQGCTSFSGKLKGYLLPVKS